METDGTKLRWLRDRTRSGASRVCHQLGFGSPRDPRASAAVAYREAERQKRAHQVGFQLTPSESARPVR